MRIEYEDGKIKTRKQHESLLYYNIYGYSPFPTNAAGRMKEIGASLQIHMQPFAGLDEVVDGEYLRNFAKEAKASGIPIFLRFAGEMNGEWVEWGLQPKKYIEKFRLVYNGKEEIIDVPAKLIKVKNKKGKVKKCIIREDGRH